MGRVSQTPGATLCCGAGLALGQSVGAVTPDCRPGCTDPVLADCSVPRSRGSWETPLWGCRRPTPSWGRGLQVISPALPSPDKWSAPVVWPCVRVTPVGAAGSRWPVRDTLKKGWEGTGLLTQLLSVGGALPPEMPSRRGKPPPLMPPLLGPSGGDREPLGLGPPAAQLTPPPAPGGPRSSNLRGLQKGGGPLPPSSGVRPCPALRLPPSTSPASCPAGAHLANRTLPPQVSLLGEPPKDYRIPLNPYLNLHSVLPPGSLAGREPRGWGGPGRGPHPPEGPPPNPPAPRGGGNKAFPLKSRLLSPLSSSRLPPEPGPPDGYGDFECPPVSNPETRSLSPSPRPHPEPQNLKDESQP